LNQAGPLKDFLMSLAPQEQPHASAVRPLHTPSQSMLTMSLLEHARDQISARCSRCASGGYVNILSSCLCRRVVRKLTSAQRQMNTGGCPSAALSPNPCFMPFVRGCRVLHSSIASAFAVAAPTMRPPLLCRSGGWTCAPPNADDLVHRVPGSRAWQ
jgi:hypothetical protein